MQWLMLATRRDWAMEWPKLGWTDLLHLLTFVVAVWVLYRLVVLAGAAHRWLRRIGPFWRVAGSAGLNWPQRWRLLRIAQRCGLGTPLSLLMSSGTLYHHARLYESQHSKRQAERIRHGVRRIAIRLYGPHRA